MSAEKSVLPRFYTIFSFRKPGKKSMDTSNQSRALTARETVIQNKVEREHRQQNRRQLKNQKSWAWNILKQKLMRAKGA